jgi:hypothetical protein
VSELEGGTDYEVRQTGRDVCCSSACCISALLAQGGELSDPDLLPTPDRELATGRAGSTHDASDHFT